MIDFNERFLFVFWRKSERGKMVNGMRFVLDECRYTLKPLES